jgi:hypothetical protein
VERSGCSSLTAPGGLGFADHMERQSPAIVSEFYAIFDGISERVAEELFDCFLHFWHGFWRFIEECAGGTIATEDRRPVTECGEKQRGTIP